MEMVVGMNKNTIEVLDTLKEQLKKKPITDRNLDVQIATRIFGMTIEAKVSPFGIGYDYIVLNNNKCNTQYDEALKTEIVPEYTSSIVWTFYLIDFLKSKGITVNLNNEEDQWYAVLGNDQGWTASSHVSLSKAISIAVLKFKAQTNEIKKLN
jgi:hypothetical protein